MSYFNSNNNNYPGYGGMNDIRMTPHDYVDFVNVLYDDNLSKGMILKFKKASMANNYYLTGSLVMPLVFGYGVARWVCGPFYQGVHRNKALMPVIGLVSFWDF